jgi:hypothetical protein
MQLARCLPGELVPAEFGGPCMLPYEKYPGQVLLREFVDKLRQ